MHDIEGQIYVSGNSKMVIDRCPNDNEHLMAPPTSNTQPLHGCRVYLDDLIPKDWIGVPGEFTVRVKRGLKGGITEVLIAFEPA